MIALAALRQQKTMRSFPQAAVQGQWAHARGAMVNLRARLKAAQEC